MGYHRVSTDRGLCSSRRSGARHLSGDLASPQWPTLKDWGEGFCAPAPLTPLLVPAGFPARDALSCFVREETRARVSAPQDRGRICFYFYWSWLSGILTPLRRPPPREPGAAFVVNNRG